ncbi:MAG: hypothetical protein M3Y65_19640 [Pseudomonadota bacterium]|nr:hypothetical protein [Pseudomonadota bacterium]
MDAARLGVQLAAGAFGRHTMPADDDDALAISLLRHATVGSGAIHWRVLRPRLSITDPDSAPLMVIAALWAAFLVALGVAHWRDRKASKIVQ